MQNIVACNICDLTQRLEPVPPGNDAHCARCGAVLFRRIPHSLERTAACALAALILYVPANVYPILKMDYLGVYSENTIWEGCVKLWEQGTWPVAVVVFLASIVIPLLKLLGLFFLVTTARSTQWRQDRTRIFKIIKVIGPWAMLDVFLLAILVALMQVGRLATVLPGPGSTAFTAVVILTMLAAINFDPRLIWDVPADEKSAA